MSELNEAVSLLTAAVNAIEPEQRANSASSEQGGKGAAAAQRSQLPSQRTLRELVHVLREAMQGSSCSGGGLHGAMPIWRQEWWERRQQQQQLRQHMQRELHAQQEEEQQQQQHLEPGLQWLLGDKACSLLERAQDLCHVAAVRLLYEEKALNVPWHECDRAACAHVAEMGTRERRLVSSCGYWLFCAVVGTRVMLCCSWIRDG